MLGTGSDWHRLIPVPLRNTIWDGEVVVQTFHTAPPLNRHVSVFLGTT